jgi:Phospholipid-binding protein
MAGTYRGYDGPCPPWNDMRVHRYHFTVYALDCEKVNVPDDFTAVEALEAIRPHILAEARITGTYAINPGVK